jgi:hypothetical protein
VFGEGHHDSVVQRGIDEALACQDMLERTPIKPSPLAGTLARLGAVVRSLTVCTSASEPIASNDIATSAVSRVGQ